MRYVAIVALLVYLNAPVAHAGPKSYVCKNESEASLLAGGDTYGLYTGKTFRVDRTTGLTIGGGVDNTRSPDIQVLDKGSDKSPFKVMSASKEQADGSRHVVYLQIEEGDEGETKSFIAISGSEMVTGTCE